MSHERFCNYCNNSGMVHLLLISALPNRRYYQSIKQKNVPCWVTSMQNST